METYTDENADPQPSLQLSFELDRRLLSVTEIEALAPGYTFALDGGALSSVAIKVNGTLLARGRIVAMDGKVGVQISETL